MPIQKLDIRLGGMQETKLTTCIEQFGEDLRD